MWSALTTGECTTGEGAFEAHVPAQEHGMCVCAVCVCVHGVRVCRDKPGIKLDVNIQYE